MGEDIAACEWAGIPPDVARPQRGMAVGDGRFPKERFRYDEAADCCHCPDDQRLDTRDLSACLFATALGALWHGNRAA